MASRPVRWRGTSLTLWKPGRLVQASQPYPAICGSLAVLIWGGCDVLESPSPVLNGRVSPWPLIITAAVGESLADSVSILSPSGRPIFVFQGQDLAALLSWYITIARFYGSLSVISSPFTSCLPFQRWRSISEAPRLVPKFGVRGHVVLKARCWLAGSVIMAEIFVSARSEGFVWPGW